VIEKIDHNSSKFKKRTTNELNTCIQYHHVGHHPTAAKQGIAAHTSAIITSAITGALGARRNGPAARVDSRSGVEDKRAYIRAGDGFFPSC
jgi:hypothetical protein